MKSILILCIILQCSGIHSQNIDSVLYTGVYNYLDSSEFVTNSFQQYFESNYSKQICISHQLITGESIAFLKEIVDYEYPNSITKDSIENVIREEYNNQKEIILDSNCFVKKYFTKVNNCNLIIFFSKIHTNRIFVDIELFTHKVDDYEYILNSLSPVAVLGLFYFDKDKIDKVYLKKIFR